MITLVVVDDHPVVRHGLVSMLHYEQDMQVVGEAGDGLEAVRVILQQNPDVVLLDLRLPQLSGIEVMKQVRMKQTYSRFLVLTTYDADEYIVPALTAGAQGIYSKTPHPTNSPAPFVPSPQAVPHSNPPSPPNSSRA